MTKAEAMQVLLLIETVYSYCTVKDESVTIWFKWCRELEYDKVIEKVFQHIKSSPYPPAISTYINEFNEETLVSSWMDEYIPRLRV